VSAFHFNIAQRKGLFVREGIKVEMNSIEGGAAKMMAAHYWAVSFVAEGGHVVVGMVQLAATFGYLFYVTRFFSRIIPLIVQTRQEWRDDVLA
jgi:ABC-type nitrate/sulfonate/bicarbonate transport system substrate-binding protein